MSSFATWRASANLALRRRYGITLEDAGLEESKLRDGYDSFAAPEQWVSWFGDKYDLEEI